jgi:hypothetical protein
VRATETATRAPRIEWIESVHGARLLNQYLDEKVYTDHELLNFGGVMLN